jgi:hypothetical protein
MTLGPYCKQVSKPITPVRLTLRGRARGATARGPVDRDQHARRRPAPRAHGAAHLMGQVGGVFHRDRVAPRPGCWADGHLMPNQIEAAARAGTHARTINSSNTEEWEQVYASVRAGAVDVVLAWHRSVYRRGVSMAKAHPDANDTLRSDGPEGVRARNDKAKRYNGAAGATKPIRFELVSLDNLASHRRVFGQRVVSAQGPRRGLGPTKMWQIILGLHCHGARGHGP